MLNEKPQLWVPKELRTEPQRDRLEALALFSTARVREQEEAYGEALRLYQRAFRCDPDSASIARAIVPLAVRLDRSIEAVRYALKVAELGEADPPLLKRLGAYLTEVGDPSRALALYEKVVAAQAQSAPLPRTSCFGSKWGGSTTSPASSPKPPNDSRGFWR